MSSKTMTKVIAIMMIFFVLATLFISIFDGSQSQTPVDNQPGTGVVTDMIGSGS